MQIERMKKIPLTNRAQIWTSFKTGSSTMQLLGNNATPPVVWFTMDLQTSHLEDRYHARIISLLLFTIKLFCIFFRINFSEKKIFFLRIVARKSGGI